MNLSYTEKDIISFTKSKKEEFSELIRSFSV